MKYGLEYDHSRIRVQSSILKGWQLGLVIPDLIEHRAIMTDATRQDQRDLGLVVESADIEFGRTSTLRASQDLAS